MVNTAATLDRKDHERFNLLITEPPLLKERSTQVPAAKNPCLLWLEISPYRVIMTRQASGQLNYRHFWEQGVYGISLYWLNSEFLRNSEQMRLRNFTRRLALVGRPFPQQLRIEYELWSEKLQLGHYILNLEISH